MLSVLQGKKIYLASDAVDFRLGMQGLADIVARDINHAIHDGSIYVFYNRAKDKIKCLMWDMNGFVLYYKRLDNMQFKISSDVSNLSYQQLEQILAGAKPVLEDRSHG